MNNFKKTPFLLSILLFIFLSTALFFLYRQVHVNNQKAQLSMVEVENEASRREEVKLLNNSIETIKRDKALIESHFAKSSDVVPFLDTIEALGPKVGVKAETTSVDISKDNTALVVQIKATGDFKNIYRFLTLLENSPYELEFTSVDIQKGGESGVDEQGIPFSNAGWEATFGIKLLSFIQ